MAQQKKFAAENRAYWTGRAESYSQAHRRALASGSHGAWRQVIAEQLAQAFPGRGPEGLRALDVGTGPGFLAILLAELGCRVTAVDYTDSMLREAQQNAGVLAQRIDFRRMDAEELLFPDECFDLVISRNVTWNLHDAAAAYRHWVRVLKPGGLLLNFDANWYRYLRDGAAMDAHLRDRRNVADSGVADDTAGTDVNAMEAIAGQAGLTGILRPDWDLRTLEALGMSAEADRDIWRRVWTREELVNNSSTPLFLIRATKTGAV